MVVDSPRCTEVNFPLRVKLKGSLLQYSGSGIDRKGRLKFVDHKDKLLTGEKVDNFGLFSNFIVLILNVSGSMPFCVTFFCAIQPDSYHDNL